MTDQEFIEFCYQQILGRKPDKEGNLGYTRALDCRYLTREEMMIQFVRSQEFESRLAARESVPSGHFYSAIPSIEEREAFVSADPSDDDAIPGINLNTEKQIGLLKEFKKYHEECPFPENQSEQFRYYFSNTAYSYSDALTLYSMIRHFAPKRIVEIGCGYSSCVMLDTSERFFGSEIALTFVDPNPGLLQYLLRPNDKGYTILPKKVQEVDVGMFSSLEANDILFVDSAHVSKLGSDVNKIIFEILPSLESGVLVHFHDIFWPFEYPKEWIREGRAWNETYILRAFLEYNESFEILSFADYLHRYQWHWFQENMPLYLKSTGGNIWIRKIGN